MNVEGTALLRGPTAIAVALTFAALGLLTAVVGTTSVHRGVPQLAGVLLAGAAFGVVFSLRAFLRLSVAIVGDTAVIKNWFRSYSVPTSEIIGFKWGSAIANELNWREAISGPDQMPYVLLQDGTHVQINSLQATRREKSRTHTQATLERAFGEPLTRQLVA